MLMTQKRQWQSKPYLYIHRQRLILQAEKGTGALPEFFSTVAEETVALGRMLEMQDECKGNLQKLLDPPLHDPYDPVS